VTLRTFNYFAAITYHAALRMGEATQSPDT
jgi:hypothetical protein